MKYTFLLITILLTGSYSVFSQAKVEKWKVFELKLQQPAAPGNPFLATTLRATFTRGAKKVQVNGFYDGKGQYKVRFMPSEEGQWTYQISSNIKKFNNKKGRFTCTASAKNNHGPVQVKDTFYLAYADGTPHHSFGTTAYAWVHQSDSLMNLTLKTLAANKFNKVRMCIFPKYYDWNKTDPPLFPFAGKKKNWDFTQFNPAYFQHLEKRIRQLDSLGIEADLIVFHPYDYGQWDFDKMDAATNMRYIEYIIARFAAYKNVWWSMANEYDLMKNRNLADWESYGLAFAKSDPYQRLRSIHNGHVFYDYTKPWITHASIQNADTQRAKEWRLKFKKPIIIDECRYEGNTPHEWGNLTPQDLTHKFWKAVINGGYAGHSETYIVEEPIQFSDKSNEVMWWSKGGVLRGESAKRIAFLRNILESAPAYLTPAAKNQNLGNSQVLTKDGAYYLIYFGDVQPRSTVLRLPPEGKYQVDIIDAWNMTIKPCDKYYSGRTLIELPGKPYVALRVVKL